MHSEFKLKKNAESKKYWSAKAKKHYNKVGSWIKGNSYLDFGGGDGHMADIFGALVKTKTVYVVDVAEWAGQKRKPNPNINFTDDLKSIKSNSINFISAWHVLHHIKEIKNTIKEFKRILKPNGRLVIYEHNVKNKMQGRFVEFKHRIFTMGMDTMTLKKHQETYSKFRSADQWQKIIGMQLLKVIDIKSNDYSYYAVFKNV